MFWQEEQEQQNDLSTDQTQLAFQFQSKQLPVDHVHALGQQIIALLPAELANQIGVHEIHLAGSQNGWERPDPALGQHLIPSRRARLLLRVPKEAMQVVQDALSGQRLNLHSYELVLGQAKEKPLQAHDTLYARHIASDETETEESLLKRIAADLATQGIQIKKALCGKSSTIQTDAGPIFTRSLMIADLSPKESLQLQQYGLGKHQHMGCGLFIPMKGIRKVNLDE